MENAPGVAPVEATTTADTNIKIAVKQIETEDLKASVEIAASDNNATDTATKDRGGSAKSTDSGLADDDDDNGVNFINEDTEGGEGWLQSSHPKAARSRSTAWATARSGIRSVWTSALPSRPRARRRTSSGSRRR